MSRAASISSRRSGISTERPRVALIVPYNTFWEASVAYDLRADREALADAAQAAVVGHVDVVARSTVASVEDGAALGRRLQEEDVEAILVLQTLAVMPSYALATLRADAKLPVVVWTAHRTRRVPPGFDHAQITSEGATVGTPMLTNMLARSGRPF